MSVGVRFAPVPVKTRFEGCCHSFGFSTVSFLRKIFVPSEMGRVLWLEPARLVLMD